MKLVHCFFVFCFFFIDKGGEIHVSIIEFFSFSTHAEDVDCRGCICL